MTTFFGRSMQHYCRGNFAGLLANTHAFCRSAIAVRAITSYLLQSQRDTPVKNCTSTDLFSQDYTVAQQHVTTLPSGSSSPARYVKFLQENLRAELPSRRERLMQQLRGSAHSAQNLLFIQPSSYERYSAPDVPYPFRQNSDFLYFTGFDAGIGVFVLTSAAAQPLEVTSHLFLQDRSSDDDAWHGRLPSEQFFRQTLAIDQLHSLSNLPSFLQSHVKHDENKNQRTAVFHDAASFIGHPHEDAWDTFVGDDTRGRNVQFEPSQIFMHTLRSRKSPAELAVIRYACTASALALKQCMLASHADMRESVLASLFELECRQRGLDGVAFPPVCASGTNAATIHYIGNKNYLNSSGEDELLLMDAGGEVLGYCADLSRTWPSSGAHFTPVQHDLYRLVLCVQTRCTEYLRESAAKGGQLPTIMDLYAFMLKTLGEACKGVGIAPKPQCQGKSLYYGARQLCRHNVGHHVGLDVHDCNALPQWQRLEVGNVITIEPGIYIGPNATFVPPEARGVGIRIEDVVYIGENGQLEVLTQACPKHMDEIEALLATKIDDDEAIS